MACHSPVIPLQLPELDHVSGNAQSKEPCSQSPSAPLWQSSYSVEGEEDTTGAPE